jgi:N-acetyltransferase
MQAAKRARVDTEARRDSNGEFVPIEDARPHDDVWPAMSWPPADTVMHGRWVEVSQLDVRRDGTELFAALADDRVWEHLPWRPATVEQFSELAESRIGPTTWTWVVRLRTSAALPGAHADLAPGTVLGMSSYLDVSVHDARLEIGATAYRPEVWGSAVNPDTKLLLLGYAFEQLGAGRVQLKTDVRNVRSQLAIARLGARYDGTLGRYQRRADGTVRDTVLFSVLAEDWPRIRDGLQARLGALAN